MASMLTDCGSTTGEKYTGRRAVKEVAKRSMVTKGPLGAKDLGAATEGVYEDIQMSRNKLRDKANLMILA